MLARSRQICGARFQRMRELEGLLPFRWHMCEPFCGHLWTSIHIRVLQMSLPTVRMLPPLVAEAVSDVAGRDAAE